ncbi:MAG: nitroreductase family protein [Ignavibacteriota bacterium]
MAILNLIPLADYQEYPVEEMLERSQLFHDNLLRRRTVRDFSDRKIPKQIIENCVAVANSAPSGANKQPWHFVVVSNPLIKKKLRVAAEEEEREFYSTRAPQEWLDALAPFGTDSNKPFLESAPYLIAIFSKSLEVLPDGTKQKTYYASESTGIASGFLISAIHNAGLVCLTHTPSPMKFLNDILGRPQNEKPFLILVVGYPEENAMVPDLVKKNLYEVTTYL